MNSDRSCCAGVSVFSRKDPLDVNRPALIHFSSTPLLRIGQYPEKYAHLLRKKDLRNIEPIVNYLIKNSDHIAFLAGDVVKNFFLHGRRRYRTINLLAILTSRSVDQYSSVMNNIVSCNDGAFAMGAKYRVRKNRGEGYFKDIAHARYIIEPRLEGHEKLLFLFKPATVELDLTTNNKFSCVFGLEEREHISNLEISELQGRDR